MIPSSVETSHLFHSRPEEKQREVLERVKGIEPSSQAWEARILPLDHTRPAMIYSYHTRAAECNRKMRLLCLSG